MKIQEEYTKFCQANAQASYQMCMSILHQLCQALDQKVATGAYMTPGGYKAYISDLKGAEHQYNATPGKGIKVIHYVLTNLFTYNLSNFVKQALPGLHISRCTSHMFMFSIIM